MSTFSSLARRALPATLLAAGLILAAPSIAAPNNYAVTNLVADVAGVANHTDPNLVNGWGVAFNPNAVVWVADNHTGVSTLYDGDGNVQSLVVTIPAASGSGQGSPTGIVYNGTRDFTIATAAGATEVPAPFIFASEDGLISAWAPPLTTTVPKATAAAVYKGLALAGNGTTNQLYAADFAGRKIDVYSATFAPVTVPGGFTDPDIPSNYGPFNITNIQGNLYVAYAKLQEGSTDEQAGAGLGFIDVFDADGFLLKHLVSHGRLNAPWGMALAPAGFGRFSNHLLVGNFGDGIINAYHAETGRFAGRLRSNGQAIHIDGLWGIAFGNGIRNQPTDALFFAAGPGEEMHGLYGRIAATAATSPGPNENDDD
jgi:uncharacterized protein (TIGR03118 family)